MISEVCHQNNILRFAKIKTRVDVEKVIYQHKVDYIVVRMSSEHEIPGGFAPIFYCNCFLAAFRDNLGEYG